MRSHKESHSNNLHGHFPCIDDEEDEIDGVDVLGDHVDFLIQGKEQTVDQDDKQDEAIEPGVDRYNLDDLVSEGVRNRQAAERYSSVVLLRVTIIWHVVIIGVRWQGFFHGLHGFDTELTKRETSDLKKQLLVG